MKFNVKTLKGTSFEIEAPAESSVRPLPLTIPPSRLASIRPIPCISGAIPCDFRGLCFLGALRLGDCAALARVGYDLNLGFRGFCPRGGWLGLTGLRSSESGSGTNFAWTVVLGSLSSVDWAFGKCYFVVIMWVGRNAALLWNSWTLSCNA